MKSIFISDLHAGLSLPHAKISGDDTTSDRLEDVLAVLTQVEEHAGTIGAENVFILGDLFDARHPDAPTLVAVAKALHDLAEVCDVYLLPGNHDAHDRAGLIYSLGMFKELEVPGIHVATKPMKISLGGIEFSLMPWIPEHVFPSRHAGGFVTWVPTGSADDRRILLIHQTVPGAVEGPYTASTGVDEDMFDGYDLTLSGHIHTPQTFSRGMYLGSPMHLRFTDADDPEPRGFWVLDHERFIKHCERDEDPAEALKLVESVGPRFIRWRFLSDGDTTALVLAADIVPELEAEAVEMDRPVYLEVIIEGEREDVTKATEVVKASLERLSGVLRHSRISRIVCDDGASDRVRSVATSTGGLASPLELAAAYLEAQRPTMDDDDLSAEDLLEFVAEVLS